MAGSNTLCKEQLQNIFTGECQTEPEIAGSMSAHQEVVTAYKDDPDPVSWEEFIQKKMSEIGPNVAQTLSTFFQPLQQAGDVDSQHLLQELQNDVKKDFLSSCQAVLECLQRLSKQSGLTLVDDEHLNVTLRQAQSKDILISVFGRFNAGKSTLLNAVMADGLLPISIRSQTMAMLKIRHAETIHRGPCRQSEPCDRCPCLIETSMGGERSLNPIQGSERVKNALATIDKKVKNENQKVTSELIIEANVPILSGVTDPWRIFLVDTPGFGTADEGISQLSKTAMETSQAYVYTMNFKEFDDGSHSRSFQLMKQKDEGVFADGRLVIAVTHFDEYYCHPEEFSSEQEVKEVVSQMIKSAVDVPFSEEKVIPLCGLWAFYGRQLRCNPNDKDLKKKCLPFLEHCYQGPRGEDREIPDLSSEEMAKTLETSSNVKALEAHIQEMAKSCVAIGIKSLHGDCCRYIKIGSEALRQRNKMLQECCQAQEKQYQETLKTQKRLTQQLIDLEGTLTFADSNTVFKELKKSYKKDKEVAVGKIKPMVEHLKTDCLKKVQRGSYRISTFWQDVDTFLETATEQLIEGQSFDNIYNYLGNLREKGGGQRNNLWKAAGSYCSTDIQTSYVHTEAGHMKQGKDIVEGRLHLGELKDDIQIPPATRWFSRMIQHIKKAFSRSTLGTDQLEEVLKQLEVSLTEKCSEYFDEAEPSIVDYFFKHGYCEIAIKGLEDFCKDFDDPMNRKDTSMEMWTRVILLLKTAVQVLERWEEHLMALGSHLNEQARSLEVERKTGLPSVQQESHSQADNRKSDTVLPEKPQTLEVAKSIIKKYRSELRRARTLPPPRKRTPLKMRERSNTMPTKPPVSSDKSKTVLTDRVKEVFAKELPKSSPPAMLGDLDGDTSDFEDDFKEELMSTCEAIATRLTKFSEVYPRILTAYSTHLIQRWKQNKQKRIQIGVFGCEKSGKKTLLNAIVANRVLPHGEVIGEVKLKHIVEVHQGPCSSHCEDCPVLFEGDESEKGICRGSVAISQMLKEQAKDMHTCVIGVSCSKLTCIPPWEVNLVYSPPFSLNMEKKGEGKRLKDAVATAQSYVYLLPYTNLENATSSELTKQFIQHSEDIFREAKKVTIAVTHFEEWYTNNLEHQNLTIEDIKKNVCKIIRETVGIKVSEEVIIPVCAEWGFTARQLQYGSQETEVKEQALKYLQSYARASGDQYQQLRNFKPTEIGVKLLKASGIQDLEQRLNTPMVLTCIEEAAERLRSDFIAKLTAAIQSLEGHLKAIEEFLEDLSKRLARFQSGQEAYKKHMGVLAQLVQTEPDESPVYQVIAEHASRDEAKILDEGKAKCHNLLNRFHKECSQRLNQQGENYGIQQLEEGLHKLLPEVSDVIMECTLSDTAFQGTCESSMEELRKVDQESESLKKSLLSTGSTSRQKNAAKPQKKIEQTFWINLDVLRDQVALLKSQHPAEQPVTITENDLASAIRQLKEEIDNLFTSYLRSTRDLVTKQGYKYFCDGVTKIMDGLEAEFELQSQYKDVWQGEPERIKKWQEHLARLRDHLQTLSAEQVEEPATSNS